MNFKTVVENKSGIYITSINVGNNVIIPALLFRYPTNRFSNNSSILEEYDDIYIGFSYDNGKAYMNLGVIYRDTNNNWQQWHGIGGAISFN